MAAPKEKKHRLKTEGNHGVPKDYLQKAAYYHWEARGCPLDDPLTDWIAVEKEWHSFLEGVEKKERNRREARIPIKVF